MWPDNETVEDLIGFRVHADLIRSVVTDQQLLPVTIGVFGDWGNGKTSIMKMLRRDLDPEDSGEPSVEGVAVLYFNGWLFEGYDDAKSALLSSVLEQLSKHKRFGPAVRDKAKSLLKRVNWMRAAKTGWRLIGTPIVAAGAAALSGLPPQIAAGVSFVSANLPQPKEKDESPLLKPPEEQDMDLRTFRDEFGKMLKDSSIKSLVVLIDDLDRCSPETIIENLEAIKLFMNVEKTAFVIGADPRIVRYAIAHRYRESVASAKQAEAAEEERLVEDYLEKLIQVPYRLPRLSPAEIETYVTLLFCKRDLSPELFTQCAAKCEELRARNHYRSFGYANVNDAIGVSNVPQSLDSALRVVSLAANLITECLKGNPRQVKRFLNAYTLRRKLASVAKLDHVRDDVLIKLMLLEYSEPQQFRDLAKWQEESSGHPPKIAELEAQTAKEVSDTWDTPKVRRWLSLEPKLTGVDLSDYFWLARDRLASSLSGLTMVPPAVRKAFEALLKKSERRLAPAMIKTFDPSEIAALHDLLHRNLTREPENFDGYDAFKALVETRPESAATFAKTLMGLQLASLPASIPGELKLLGKGKPAVEAEFKPVLERIQSDPKTRAGKAMAPKPPK
jgi:hypothetical protein